MNKDLATIISDNEQDRANGKEWFDSLSNDERLLVATAIFGLCNSQNPLTGSIGRLAQLAFAEFVEAKAREELGDAT